MTSTNLLLNHITEKPMKVVCLTCKKDIREVESTHGGTSHGYCDSCAYANLLEISQENNKKYRELKEVKDELLERLKYIAWVPDSYPIEAIKTMAKASVVKATNGDKNEM